MRVPQKESHKRKPLFPFLSDHFCRAGFFRPKFNILWRLGLSALTAFYRLPESTSLVQPGVSELNLPKATEAQKATCNSAGHDSIWGGRELKETGCYMSSAAEHACNHSVQRGAKCTAIHEQSMILLLTIESLLILKPKHNKQLFKKLYLTQTQHSHIHALKSHKIM